MGAEVAAVGAGGGAVAWGDGAGGSAGDVAVEPCGPRCSTGAGACPGGKAPQPVSAPRIDSPAAASHPRAMWLIILEAMGALGLLIFIVWWTMFAGRAKGELPPDDRP